MIKAVAAAAVAAWVKAWVKAQGATFLRGKQPGDRIPIGGRLVSVKVLGYTLGGHISLEVEKVPTV